ncbi:deoxyribodipyrimidine photo-lyase [Motilimonas cestriensis]|uniref:Deoxyribodipyrimidine photo-lyase n=1 Tax=Motilimonas cestriensis TaxID=2742685 RepID=A0ABS8WD42_9GAMM|nr:deoxyribodipyrimidine photo-lyase [Motilimonas cestriensis]MCE2596190.1 deoxyribodipyrimidine photo-lyase [Motilimonas cestriensis]
MNLVWLRKDLRISDNPALAAAMASGTTLALFISSPAQWQEHNLAPIQADFIEQNLQSVVNELAQLGVATLHHQVDLFTDIPSFLLDFCQQHQIQQIFANTEPELNEVRRDRAVLEAGLPLQLFEGHSIMAPGTVFTQAGTMFKVFTPFRKQWLEKVAQQWASPLAKPIAIGPAVEAIKIELACPKRDSSAWLAGEDEAQQRLSAFVQHKVADYKTYRDMPALDQTSGLSGYLAVGALSAKQCLHQVLQHYPDALNEQESGAFCWISELAWRDFYRHLLIAHPKLSMGYNFVPKAANIQWSQNDDDFAAWCEGRTGYPLVDAAMRQLNETGWMHNRLRMVVASFLTKHLLIDWRRGEQYFSQQLIDADLASNNGGWQWAASTGCDAQPYFRIFNPIRQSERFDPDGTFIRKYCTELINLTAKNIHMPKANERPIRYVKPLVEHSFARQRALDAFAVLGKG